jgi:Argonaute PAZ domain/Piwi domain
MKTTATVYINRFFVKKLSPEELEFYCYSINFDDVIDAESLYRKISNILYKTTVVGARLGVNIITQHRIPDANLTGDGWHLQFKEKKAISLKNTDERKTLEQFNRKILWEKMSSCKANLDIEKSFGGGFTWWNNKRIEDFGDGWKVLRARKVDLAIDPKGDCYLEIDCQSYFDSDLLLEDWMQKYPEIPVDYVQNTYDGQKWKFERCSDESPESLILSNTSMSLAEYHRKQNKVSFADISRSKIVYVKSTKRRSKDSTPHLSCLLRPRISMEMLANLAEKGDISAKEIFKKLKKRVDYRLIEGSQTAKWIINKIYRISTEEVIPQKFDDCHIFQPPQLFAKDNKNVKNAAEAFKVGFLKTGETNFVCLHLDDGYLWPKLVYEDLIKLSNIHEIKLNLDIIFKQSHLPCEGLERQLFWDELANNNIYTALVISPWLGSKKNDLCREALNSGIALQFMQPCSESDPFKVKNVVLGLLLKAQWQSVGVKRPEFSGAADIVIGFDAGTDGEMFYGTSAFAVLSNGQTLGWQIPSAQKGERISGDAIWQSVASIIKQYRQEKKVNPKRVLLLRDGFVRKGEFDLTIKHLEKSEIAIDLLEIHKSGAGRMAIKVNSDEYKDAIPGTVVQICENSFRLITTVAKSGSARPLEIVRKHGDAKLGLLAMQVYVLSGLHPGSAFSASRLPMPSNYADKMAKAVQRFGQISILSNVNRYKIFFV